MTTTTRRNALRLAAVTALGIARHEPTQAAPAPALDELDVETDPGMTDERCAAARADYETAWRAVIALDPAFATFRHPVTLLDEAAIGLYLTAFDAGHRLGLAGHHDEAPDAA